MNLFWIFLTFLILQRLSELILARRNEKIVRAKGAREYDAGGYKIIVLMHIAFLASLFAEYILFGRNLNQYWLPLIFLFIVAQIVRYWAIGSLGYYWNTKILITPRSRLVTKGPYKCIKHPNYLAVTIEIGVIPLIFSCYITAVTFTIINIILLRRRIKIEEDALSTLNN